MQCGYSMRQQEWKHWREYRKNVSSLFAGRRCSWMNGGHNKITCFVDVLFV